MAEERKLGMVWPPVEGDLPAVKNPGRRSDVEKIADYIREQNKPGKAYMVGYFKSGQAPRKQWAEYGLNVRHVQTDDGTFERWVTLADSTDATVTPINRGEDAL